MSPDSPSQQRLVVIGGGIAGLTVAYNAARDGFAVTVVEASERLGGLGTYFDHHGLDVDCFYHCIVEADTGLRALLDEIGMADDLYWKPATMGFVVEGERFDFNSAADLLRFAPLRFDDRLRLGAMTLGLGYLGRGKDLDAVTTASWFKRMFGPRVWAKVWEPLFAAKFGDGAATLPALYMTERMDREERGAERAYPRSGFKGIIDTLVGRIEALGGTVLTGTSVHSIRPIDATEPNGPLAIEVDGEPTQLLEADWVVSTAPLPQLDHIVANTPLAGTYRDPQLPYQGVVNALFFLRKPLDGHYSVPVVASDAGFAGVVEMTALVERTQVGGHHLVYVMDYCGSDSANFARPDDEIVAEWSADLVRLYGDRITAEDIVEVRVFRAPYVEPIYPVGYSTMKPEIRCGDTRLLLCTTAQAYPQITAWNSSVNLANDTTSFLNSVR